MLPDLSWMISRLTYIEWEEDTLLQTVLTLKYWVPVKKWLSYRFIDWRFTIVKNLVKVIFQREVLPKDSK